MNDINFSVYKNTLKRTDGFSPVSGEGNYTRLIFHFRPGDDWDNCTAVTVSYYKGNRSATHSNTAVSDGTATFTVPDEVIRPDHKIYFCLQGSYTEGSVQRTIVTNVIALNVNRGYIVEEGAAQNVYESLLAAVNQIAAAKANAADVTAALALKANAADVYTKTEADSGFASKFGFNTFVTETYADDMTDLEDAIDLKANSSDVAAALALKADAADVTAALALKANAEIAEIQCDLSDMSFETGYYNAANGSKNDSTSSWIKTTAATMLYLKKGTKIVIDNITCWAVGYRSTSPSSATFLWGLKTGDVGYTLTVPTDAYVTLSYGGSVDAETAKSKTQITLDKAVYAADKVNVLQAVVYVATDGDDTNDGTVDAPFATVNHALEVANNVIVKPGVYHQRIQSTHLRNEVSVVADPDREMGEFVVFDLSETLAFATDGDLVSCAYAAETTDKLYTVFVSKTLSPTAQSSSARGMDYRVVLWSEDGKTLYTPYVGDKSGMSSGQFTYDGSKIYIKGAAAGNYRLSDRTSGSVVNITNASHVVLSEMEFGYSYDTVAVVAKCQDYKILGCVFEHSSTGNGLGLSYSSGECISCRAGYVANDGFSYHATGTSLLTDCEGHHCLSGDGVSHHFCCRGSIQGGRWHHCGKAGISDPTYGALVNISGANVYDNTYGIQIAYGTLSAGAVPLVPQNTKVSVSGCLVRNNETGISCSNYDAEIWGCVFSGNTTDISGTTPIT